LSNELQIYLWNLVSIYVLTKWKEVFQGNNAIVMLQWNQIGVVKSNNIIITPPLKQKRGWWEWQYFGHTSVLH
jgi:hypothetical protein